MTKVIIIAALYSLMCSSSLFADDYYVCTNENQERIISIIYKDQIKKLPCEVHYKKHGRGKVIWKSNQLSGFCENKAEKLIQKHKNWGWECNNKTNDITPSKTVVDTSNAGNFETLVIPETPETGTKAASPALVQSYSEQIVIQGNSKEKKIAVSSARAAESSLIKEGDAGMSEILETPETDAVSPNLSKNYQEQIAIQAKDNETQFAFLRALSAVRFLKKDVTSFYLSMGKLPESFNDLGLKPEIIKKSPRFKDLAIGKNGELYIQVNESLGFDTVIKLTPIIILNGYSFDWQCSTNIKIDDLYSCKFDKSIIFPS